MSSGSFAALNVDRCSESLDRAWVYVLRVLVDLRLGIVGPIEGGEARHFVDCE
jgi:hypothetical protein